MEKDTDFRISFVDTSEPINKYYDSLPHWDQLGKVQFITFRLADSLPQTKLDELKAKIEVFNKRYPKPWDKDTEKLYYSTIGKKVEYWLDLNYGSCVLKYEEVREKMVEGWLKHHKKSFYLHEFVIMPNHVHILLSPYEKLEDCLKLIKGSASFYVNRTLERKGTVWMKSDFDRMVRSEDSFRYYVDYIHKNPRGLPNGTYTLWSDPKQLWQKEFQKRGKEGI